MDVLLKARFVRVRELWQYFYMTGCAECCFNVPLHVWVFCVQCCGIVEAAASVCEPLMCVNAQAELVYGGCGFSVWSENCSDG